MGWGEVSRGEGGQQGRGGEGAGGGSARVGGGRVGDGREGGEGVRGWRYLPMRRYLPGWWVTTPRSHPEETRPQQL